MRNYRSIEIDFDVHKLIEIQRLDFSETPNDVLRRLLKLGPAEKPAPDTASTPVAANGAWSGKGVVLPASTQVRMEYRGQVHTGEIQNGEWVIEGRRYKSPSKAAGSVATTKAGTKPSLNGWIYWHVRRPGDEDWTLIDTLRSTQ